MSALSIIKSWKQKYNKTKSVIYAQMVYRVTGEEPDGIQSVGYGKEEFEQKPKETEDQLINDLERGLTYPY